MTSPTKYSFSTESASVGSRPLAPLCGFGLSRALLFTAVLGVSSGTALVAEAQSNATPPAAAAVPTTTAPAPEAKTVVLDPFTVSSKQVGPYQVSEALVGGRVRANLFESSANISIVTSELIADTAPRDIFNAAKYLAGIANNSSQVAGDRVSIRGFQVSSPNIDGFATLQSVVKQDPALYDRIEFVRGPDALLAPSGSPGGSLNLISKTAKFENFGSVTGQLGQYDTNSANFDVNQLASKTVAYRVIGSYINDEQGYNQGYHRSYAVSPSMLVKVGHDSELLLHFTYVWGNGYNYLGFPIDPATSATTPLKMLPGLNIRQNSYADNYGDISSANHTNRAIYRSVFTTRLNEHLSMRLAARYITEWETNNQWNLLGNAGGSTNPLTGEWTPGVVWSANAPYVPSPAPAVSPTYSLSQSPNNLKNRAGDVQNDFVYQKANDRFDSETSAGFAAEFFHQDITGYAATSPAINIYNIPQTATWTLSTTPSSNQDVTGNFMQVYLSEKLKLLHNSVILNASVVPTWFSQKVENHISGLSPSNKPNPTFFNYGVAYVPVPYASLYYGHSEDAAQIVNVPTASNPNPPQLQSGKQDEIGLRLKFLEGRLAVSVAYYDLQQTNNVIVNPALFSVPPPTVTPPPILADRTAKGWEYEVNLSLNKQLSFIGSYTNNKNRSPYGVRFRANPENSGAGFLNYRFTDGSLKGLALGVGYTYQGTAAGDSASGVTRASTPTLQIPNLPTFYLPAYGLWNITASYKVDNHWMIRGFIDNVFNETYYAGSLNRNAVMPGLPTNFRTAVTYSF